jgi:ribosomal protein S18 acetylase RimI-like enzyme
MELMSLAWRTDLALLGYSGSEVLDRGDHLVVRTPDNPSYYWGNFLLLASAPTADEVAGWVETCEREFPGSRHRALGIDGADGHRDDLAPFLAHDFTAECQAVMTATAVHEPPRPNTEATIRPLVSDEDWERQVALARAGEEPELSVAFASGKAQAHRRLVEQGRGAWFGAFLGDELVSSLGLFVASEGLARFQDVKTHPDARGQGLCGTLVHAAGGFGFDRLGVHTLVMVADPDYLAIRVYRSVGFSETEAQLQVLRRPAD